MIFNILEGAGEEGYEQVHSNDSHEHKVWSH